MKVNKLAELKTQYSFEAPVLPANVRNYKSKVVQLSEGSIDLNTYLAPYPKNIYLVRVQGESMINDNIFNGDVLVVDKTEIPKDNKVVIASLNGEMAVKRFRIIDGKAYLYSANEKFLPIEILPFWQFEIQGVVKHVIHSV
ncbi:MAG: LexA family transcriptional regulator [Candidatus Kapabacteria bacterium]|nr:LexA family transcriptional regulator [Candidatus Kapabacteria bacterium]